ncbi:hypothetical protein [Streptomyces chartreusis]|uniref:hypothetical protein n=1 Tax=Streptomyces chartreusis TaxID=1969 RepID=UPI002E813B3C|nr:hypothetical protein [Streptomyces chartreusis]WUB23241.1 hypothetical protein OG997_44040 [Streptomyces chartreusis]
MSNPPRTAELAELDTDLPAPVRDFVSDLRTYFHRLEVSVRVYAVRRNVAAGTLSRYLNGKRAVPWKFVEDLLADTTEHCGAPPTPEAVSCLRVLHEADRQCRRRPASGLNRLEDRLRDADQEVGRLRAQERVLTKALQDSEHQHAHEATRRTVAEAELHELHDKYRVQADALTLWRGVSLGLLGGYSSLEQEAALLRQALAETQAALRAAEAHRDHLEQQLLAAEELLEEGISGASLMEVLEAADRTTPVPELVQLVGGLATSPRQAFASELVTSASRCRPVQEVQALLSALYQAGLHKHAEAALPAMVAMRPVQDTADLVAELLHAGLEEPVVSLLQASVELHTPHDLASLAGLLHQRGRDDAVTVLLGATATHRTAEEIVTVCTLLARPDLNGILTEIITTPVRERSCAELTTLVIHLHQSSVRHLAETLQRAMALHRAATDVAELIAALHQANLPDAANTVFWQTQQRTTGYLVALTSALHTANLDQEAAEVLSHALSSRPVADNASLIVDLHVAGRLQDASNALATVLRSFPSAYVRDILDRLDQIHPGMNARSLLTEAATRGSAADAADMLVALLDCHLSEHAQAVYSCTVQQRPTGHAAAALRQLEQRRPHYLTPPALQTQARTSTASQNTNLALALHMARLPGHFDAVLSGGALERTPIEAAMVVHNLEALRLPSKGQSIQVADHLLARAVQDYPIDRQLAWVTALEASAVRDAAKRLIDMAYEACPTQEFSLKLYALRVSGRLVDRGPGQLLLWRLRRLTRIFD